MSTRHPRRTRLPWAPVERYLTLRYDHLRQTKTALPDGRLLDDNVISALVQVHRTQIYRFRREGVTIYYADRIACTLGLHPLELWPEFHEVPDFEEVAA